MTWYTFFNVPSLRSPPQWNEFDYTRNFSAKMMHAVSLTFCPLMWSGMRRWYLYYIHCISDIMFWEWQKLQHPTIPAPLQTQICIIIYPMLKHLPQEVWVVTFEEATASNSFLVGRWWFIWVRRWLDDGHVIINVWVSVKVYHIAITVHGVARTAATCAWHFSVMFVSRLRREIFKTFVQVSGAAGSLELRDPMELVAAGTGVVLLREIHWSSKAVQVVFQPAGGGKVLILLAPPHQKIGAVDIQEDFRSLCDSCCHGTDEGEMVSAQHVASRGRHFSCLWSRPCASRQSVLSTAVVFAMQSKPHPPPKFPPVHGGFCLLLLWQSFAVVNTTGIHPPSSTLTLPGLSSSLFTTGQFPQFQLTTSEWFLKVNKINIKINHSWIKKKKSTTKPHTDTHTHTQSHPNKTSCLYKIC